jgi:hypothetical protein
MKDMKEPSLRDVFAGIGTAFLAAAVMLAAAFTPLLLLIFSFQHGAGPIFVGSLFAAGVLASFWMRSRQHAYAHRRLVQPKTR